MKKNLRIATRKSPLALWQAEEVRDQLIQQHPQLTVDLVPMTTRGDQLLGSPLAKIGGKGLFIKELERAMLDDQADLAVHSVKDMPASMPEGFRIAAILARENPFDAFVSNSCEHFSNLPAGARVGTCSLRRKAQLLHARPDLTILDLRGNVNTRLAKLDDNQFDAIILAAAGLTRLGMAERIRHTLDPDLCLPAVGQGAIGIEITNADEVTLALVNSLEDPDTLARITAERALNAALNGGCQAPIAGFAELEGNTLHMTARILTPDGQTLLQSKEQGSIENAGNIGHQVAESLLQQGGGEILAELGLTNPVSGQANLPGGANDA